MPVFKSLVSVNSISFSKSATRVGIFHLKMGLWAIHGTYFQSHWKLGSKVMTIYRKRWHFQHLVTPTRHSLLQVLDPYLSLLLSIVCELPELWQQNQEGCLGFSCLDRTVDSCCVFSSAATWDLILPCCDVKSCRCPMPWFINQLSPSTNMPSTSHSADENTCRTAFSTYLLVFYQELKCFTILMLWSCPPNHPGYLFLPSGVGKDQIGNGRWERSYN